MRTRLGMAGLTLAALISAATANATTVAVKSGNIVCRSASHVRQITTDGKDSEPVLSPDSHTVVFIHKVKSDENPSDESGTLWIGDCRSGSVNQVLAQTAKAGRPEDRLDNIGGPHFAPDGQFLYFGADAWGDELAVHKLDMRTKKQAFVFAGELAGVIRTGPYRGDLLATQRTAMGPPGQEYGAYAYYVFTPDGKEVLHIPDSEKWDDKALAKWLKKKGWTAW